MTETLIQASPEEEKLEVDSEPSSQPGPLRPISDVEDSGDDTDLKDKQNDRTIKTPAVEKKGLFEKLKEKFGFGEKQKVITTEKVDATQENEEVEKIDKLDKITNEIHQREEKRLESRYGKNLIGKASRWLNETHIGRMVKVGGKVIGGVTAATVIVPTLAGTAGLLASVALFSLGTKIAIDGLIESVQYLCKGDNLRLNLEAAKQDLFDYARGTIKSINGQKERGEITEDKYTDELQKVLTEIANKEQQVLVQEEKRVNWESKQKMIRGIASTVLSIFLTAGTGVTLGHQVFKGSGHAVNWSFRGFSFIYKAGEQAALDAYRLAGGALAHSVGPTVSSQAFVGLGAALVGMAAKTVEECKQIFNGKEITTEQLKEIELSNPEVIDNNKLEVKDSGTDQVQPPEQSSAAASYDNEPGAIDDNIDAKFAGIEKASTEKDVQRTINNLTEILKDKQNIKDFIEYLETSGLPNGMVNRIVYFFSNPDDRVSRDELEAYLADSNDLESLDAAIIGFASQKVTSHLQGENLNPPVYETD